MLDKESEEGREDQHHSQEDPVQAVIDRGEISILHFVEHQKAVMLAHHVIIGPHGDQQSQVAFASRKHHDWPQRKEKGQASEEQDAMAATGLSIKEGARSRAKYVGAIEAERPEPPEE